MELLLEVFWYMLIMCVITGNSDEQIAASHHNSRFHVSNLGELRYFLGWEISGTAEGIFTFQRKSWIFQGDRRVGLQSLKAATYT